jgi:predicted transcriptional regulator of viral defense system
MGARGGDDRWAVGENLETRNSHGFQGSRSADAEIAALAARQHGAVSFKQLRDLGSSEDQIEYRLRVGRLHRVHRGVYAVGHRRLSRAGQWMAATLVAEDTLLSHRSAAELLKLRDPTGSGIHVTSQAKLGPRDPLVVHRRSIPADERTTVDGIPATSLSRTLLDLAATEGAQALTRALRQAHFHRLAGSVSLPGLLERYPRRRGTAVVERVLAEGAYSLRTRSPLEDEFLEFLTARGLPLPETNAIVEAGGEHFEVDCLWRGPRLIVELDGHAAHGTPEALEADRRRDGLLGAHSYSVQRLTARRLARDGDRVERQLRVGLLLSSRP